MKKLIHLSDLHFRENWEEEQGMVLEAFFKDISKQVEQFEKQDVYVVFSGDVALAGAKPELYSSFLKQFNDELTKIGIPKSQRICIPGNHDVNREKIVASLVEHEGIIRQELSEKEFNDFISKPANLLISKFDNYAIFEPEFAESGVSESITGSGKSIEEHIAIYCLNTALCSSGGVEKDGRKFEDKGRLSIDTRSLNKWLLNCKARVKILVMHHPLEWLSP